jgi:S-adenosylhomocysteine hydrolase
MGFRTSVYDKDPFKQIAAMLDGHETGQLSDLVASSKIIIGVTGDTSVTLDEILRAPDGAYVVSGSSKNIEIDIPDLESFSYKKIRTTYGFEYSIINGKRIGLLFNGWPINFRGKSIPAEVIDPVLSMLLLAAINLTQRYFPSKIHNVREFLNEEDLARLYLKIHQTKEKG